MTRAWLVLLLLGAACAQRGGGKPTREVVPTRVLDPGAAGSGSAADAINYQAGPSGFPIPRDASTVEDTPPDHTFKVPRRSPEVVSEIKVNLAQQGFKVVDEYVEDVLHTHWYITKESVVYKVTLAGDEAEHTLIILTVE